MNIGNLMSLGDCSNKLTVNVSNEVIKNISNEVETNISASTDANVIAVQSQKVTINNPPRNVDITIEQKMDIKFDARTNSTQSSQATILNNLVTKIENSLKQKMEQTLGVMAVGSAGFDSYTKFTTKLKTLISNYLSSNQAYEDTKNVIGIQDQQIVINYKDNDPEGQQIFDESLVRNGKIYITQSSVIQFYVETTISQSISFLNNNDELVDLANKIDQQLKQEVKGFDAIVDSIMSFFKSGIFAVMLVVIAVIIGGVAIWYFFLQNPENVKTLTSAATEMAKGKGL